MPNISNTLRKAVQESGWTVNGIATRIGVATSTLKRFMDGDTSPFSLGDKLGGFLGLELIEEINWTEHVEAYWPDYAEDAWKEALLSTWPPAVC